MGRGERECGEKGWEGVDQVRACIKAGLPDHPDHPDYQKCRPKKNGQLIKYARWRSVKRFNCVYGRATCTAKQPPTNDHCCAGSANTFCMPPVPQLAAAPNQGV